MTAWTNGKFAIAQRSRGQDNGKDDGEVANTLTLPEGYILRAQGCDCVDNFAF